MGRFFLTQSGEERQRVRHAIETHRLSLHNAVRSRHCRHRHLACADGSIPAAMQLSENLAPLHPRHPTPPAKPAPTALRPEAEPRSQVQQLHRQIVPIAFAALSTASHTNCVPDPGGAFRLLKRHENLLADAALEEPARRVEGISCPSAVQEPA
jgi:hypothetical protein